MQVFNSLPECSSHILYSVQLCFISIELLFFQISVSILVANLTYVVHRISIFFPTPSNNSPTFYDRTNSSRRRTRRRRYVWHHDESSTFFVNIFPREMSIRFAATILI